MPTHQVLQSWKQIADYVGRTERTLQRWEREFGFPVHRASGKSRSAVMALKNEIQEWTRGKPSLVDIRRVPRMNRSSMAALAGDNQRAEGLASSSSLLEPPADPGLLLTAYGGVRNSVCEHRRVSGLLYERQKKLRADVRNLLLEQQRLCAQLRFNRERSSAIRQPKATQALA